MVLLTRASRLQKAEGYVERAKAEHGKGNEKAELNLLYQAALIVLEPGFDAGITGTPERRSEVHGRFAIAFGSLGNAGSNYPVIVELEYALKIRKENGLSTPRGIAGLALVLRDELLESADRAGNVGRNGTIGRALYDIEKNEWLKRNGDKQHGPFYPDIGVKWETSLRKLMEPLIFPYGLTMALEKTKEAIALEKEYGPLWPPETPKNAEQLEPKIARRLFDAIMDLVDNLDVLSEPVKWMYLDGEVVTNPYPGFEKVPGHKIVPTSNLVETIELLKAAIAVVSAEQLDTTLLERPERMLKEAQERRKNETVGTGKPGATSPVPDQES